MHIHPHSPYCISFGPGNKLICQQQLPGSCRPFDRPPCIFLPGLRLDGATEGPSGCFLISLQLSPSPSLGTISRTRTNTTPIPAPLSGFPLPPFMLLGSFRSGQGGWLASSNKHASVCSLSLRSPQLSLGLNVKPGGTPGKGHKTWTIPIKLGCLVTLLMSF